jgi:peptide/nickel transport system substrate-binding protein/oligopeptide transport system substrate-binding protein
MSRLSALLVLVLALFPAAALAAGEVLDAPDEFVVAFNDLDVQFDPHHSIYAAEAQLFTGIYEGLFSYNPSTLDPVKSACKSFTKSRDGRTYTFYIRDEASWSDGSPLLASDFRDAWLRAIGPQERADYASFFDIIAGAKEYRLGKTRDAGTVGITVISDKVLQVKLVTQAPYFTRLLCHHSFSPIHPSMLKVRDWSAALPFPVNGAYVVASHGKDGIVLERNPKYWDSASVKVPRIRIILSDDDKAVTTAFDNGEIHWLAGPMDLDALLERDAIQISPMFGTQYWFFDCKSAPWSDSKLRRALALLLPWGEIRSKDAYFMPAPTLVLPFDGYEKAKGITKADEKEAFDLLEKAGFPDGKGLPAIVILVPEGGEDAARVAGLMKAAWEKLPGFKVDVVTVPSASYFARMRQGPVRGGYTLGLTTWIGDFADPLAFLGMFTSDSNLNDPRYADPEYDNLLQAAASKDGDARLDALAEAETHLLAAAPILPLYHNLAANVIDTAYIQGWFSNALDLHPFKYLAFGEKSVRSNVAARPALSPTAALAAIPAHADSQERP